LPVQFWDFYTPQNLSLSEAVVLVNGIKLAWSNQNFLNYDISLQNQLKANIYSVIPYGPTAQDSIVYRIIYSIGFTGFVNLNQNIYPKYLDITDLASPNDNEYNSTLNPYLNVLNRTIYSKLKDLNSIKVGLIDTVVGVIIYQLIFYNNKHRFNYYFNFRFNGG